MAIRLRTVNGVRVALCAAETDPLPDDLYLDDLEHESLAAKFAADWQGRTINWRDEVKDAAAATQKLRDAREELEKWLSEQYPT